MNALKTARPVAVSSFLKSKRFDNIMQFSEEESVVSKYAMQIRDVYVIGMLQASFPSEGIKEEFYRCACELEDDSTDPLLPPCYFKKHPVPKQKKEKQKAEQQLIQSVLDKRENRYLARELDWQLTDQFDNVIYCLAASEYNVSALINNLGKSVLLIGDAQPMGADVPVLMIQKISDAQELMSSAKQSSNASDPMDSLRNDLYPVTKNSGATDEDRAINHLFYNDQNTYETYQYICGGSYSHKSQVKARLQQIHTTSTSSGDRLIIEVIFEFYNFQNTVLESWMAAVDVTDLYPFVVRSISPYLPIY